MVLAAIESNWHEQLSPIISDLYAIDVEVGLAKSNFFNSNKDESIKSLGDLHEKAMNLNKQLLDMVTSLKHKLGINYPI